MPIAGLMRADIIIAAEPVFGRAADDFRATVSQGPGGHGRAGRFRRAAPGAMPVIVTPHGIARMRGLHNAREPFRQPRMLCTPQARRATRRGGWLHMPTHFTPPITHTSCPRRERC